MAHWEPRAVICGNMVAVGTGGHAVSLAQASRVHNIDNPVVLGKPSEESAVASRAAGVFGSTSRSSDRGHGRQQWWPMRVVYLHLAAGPASVACVVAGALCAPVVEAREGGQGCS